VSNLLHKVVRVVGENGKSLFVGKAMTYQPKPSYTVELEDGQLLAFPADQCEEADETVKGLYFLLREAMKKLAEKR
jgi:hypothetical protein